MLVLFDIDDTLIDDAAATGKAVDALREHFEVRESPLEFRSRWHDSLRHHFDRFVAGHTSFQEQRRARVRDALGIALSDRQADEAFDVYLSVYEDSWKLFDDVLPCLDAIGHERLGVVSNGNAEQQRHKLARLGILDRFAWIVISQECGWSKPDSRIFARACELARTAPSAAIHVGDRHDVDVLGAIRAGLRAVWLDRHGCRSATHWNSCPRLSTLAELPALVDESSLSW